MQLHVLCNVTSLSVTRVLQVAVNLHSPIMDNIAELALNVKILRDNIQCPVCFDVINEPITTTCNHNFCCCCFKKLFTTRGSVSCPVCHTKLSRRSYARNELLDQVVLAVEGLVNSLRTDTGIDFCKEEFISSCEEEVSTNHTLPKLAQRKKFNNPPSCNSGESEKEKELLDVESKGKKLSREQRYKKQYKSKCNTTDDSFMFPAEFIHPRSRTKIPTNKVESWLQENEDNLNVCEDLSILNGSLPKRAYCTDVLGYSSEEELFSISQVNWNARTYVAPPKTSVKDILDKPEGSTEISNPVLEQNKDPYEFFSSQSNQNVISEKSCVTKKRQGSKGSMRNKNPLWQNISVLVQETSAKKKGEKRQVTDASFQESVAMNDTFDNLLAGTKKTNIPVNKMTISEEKVEENTNCAENTSDVLIFKSQTNAIEEWEKPCTSDDFSSGSVDEWGEAKKNIKRIEQRSRGRKSNTPKLKLSSRRTRSLARNEETVNKLAENMNHSFQEIDNYKLVTASQVERETPATKKNVSEAAAILLNCADDVCKPNSSTNKELQEESSLDCGKKIGASSAEESQIVVNLGNVSKKQFPPSQGWSRMSELKKEFTAPKKCPLKTLNVSSDTMKRKLSSNEKKKSLKSNNRNAHLNSKVPVQSKENKTLENPGQNKSVTHTSECNDDTGLVTDKANLSPPVCAPTRVHFSSPGEPVRYLELSQSQERSKVMQNIIHLEELSIAREVSHLGSMEKEGQISAPCTSQLSLTICSAPNIDDLVTEGMVKIPQNRFTVCNFEPSTQTSAILTDGGTQSEKPVYVKEQDEHISTPPVVKDKYPVENTHISPGKAEACVSRMNQPCEKSSVFPYIPVHENSNAAEQISSRDNVCQSRNWETKESERNLPLSYDPFKCSDKSSEEIPPGQISREAVQPAVKFTKASKFTANHKLHFPFLYLGSCVSQEDKRNKTTRWIIKVTASERASAIEVEREICDSKSSSQVREIPDGCDRKLFSSIEFIDPVLNTLINLPCPSVKEDSCEVHTGQQRQSSNSQAVSAFKAPVESLLKDITSKSHNLPTTEHSRNEKEVLVPPFLSAVRDDSCKILTKSLPKKLPEDKSTHTNGENESAAKSSEKEAVNGRSNEDDDYLLSSEELLQRVRDNINEDLGIGKSLKGTRKKLPSYSDDDDIVEEELSCSPKRSLVLSGSDCSRKRHLTESEEECDEVPRKKFQNFTLDGTHNGTDLTSKPYEKNLEKGLILNGEDQRTVDRKEKQNIVGSSALSDKARTNVEQMDAEQDLFLDDDNDVIEGTPVKDSTLVRHKSPEQSESCATGAKHDKTHKALAFILPHSSRSIAKKVDTDKTAENLRLSGETKSLQLLESPNNTECEIIDKSSVRKSARNLFGISKTNESASEGPPLSTKEIDSSKASSVQKKQSTVYSNTTSDAKGNNTHVNKVFVCSGLNQNLVLKVKGFAKLIGAEFSDIFTPSTTHLIVNVDENRATTRTLKYLQAVASGKWIVSYSWIVASLSARKFLPEEEFEVLDSLGVDGPRRSRLRTGNLFQNIQICLKEPFTDITIDKLQEIIVICGGIIVQKIENFRNTSSGFRVIILEPECPTDEVTMQSWLLQYRAVALSSDWLLDCIGSYCLQPIPSLCLGSWSYEQLSACGIPEELLVEEDLETTAGYTEVSGVSRLQTS